MTTRSWTIIGMLFFAFNLAGAQQDGRTIPGSWSGVIVNSGCSSDEAWAETAKCTERVPQNRKEECL